MSICSQSKQSSDSSSSYTSTASLCQIYFLLDSSWTWDDEAFSAWGSSTMPRWFSLYSCLYKDYFLLFPTLEIIFFLTKLINFCTKGFERSALGIPGGSRLPGTIILFPTSDRLFDISSLCLSKDVLIVRLSPLFFLYVWTPLLPRYS